MESGIIVNRPDLARDFRGKAVALPAGRVILITTEGLRDRQVVIIRNVGKDVVYLGGSDVSEENGFPLFAKEVIVLPSSKEVFAISPKKDGEVRLLEG